MKFKDLHMTTIFKDVYGNRFMRIYSTCVIRSNAMGYPERVNMNAICLHCPASSFAVGRLARIDPLEEVFAYLG